MSTSKSPQTTAESPPVTGPGQLLLAAREEHKISLQEISSLLNLSTKKIEALERDDYSAFAGRTYARGYLLSYARHLLLNPDLIDTAFTAVFPETLQTEFKPLEYGPEAPGSTNKMWIGLLVLLLVALGITAYYAYGNQPNNSLSDSALIGPDDDNADGPTVATEPQPLSNRVESLPRLQTATNTNNGRQQITSINLAVHSNPQGPQAGTNAESVSDAEPVSSEILLRFAEECWADIRAGDGSKLLYNLQPAGSEISFSAALPIKVFLGNAPAVKIFYNGENYDYPTRGPIAQFVLDAPARETTIQ